MLLSNSGVMLDGEINVILECFKNKKASLNLKKFANEPKEIKFKIFNTLLKNTAKSYYPPRSRKVLNLIRRFENKSFTKSTLGGCIFERKKNFLLISREF